MSTAHDTDRLRKKELALIHVLKKQIGLEDEDYRYLKLRVTADFRESPVDSAAAMTSVERKALIQELHRLGGHSGPPKGEKRIFGESKEPHVRKLYACAYQLIRDGATAPRDPARWLRKFTKALTGVEDPRWTTALDCNKVIEALKAWHRRLDERAAQKAKSETTPSAKVKKVVGELMERVAGTAEPREGTRKILALLAAHAWPSARIADQVIELTKQHGARVHIALADWDYRRARKELLVLIEKIDEVAPDCWGAVKIAAEMKNSDRSETQQGARLQSNKVEDGR